MQYMLLIYAAEGGWDAMPPEAQEAEMAKWWGYSEEMRTAGVMVAGATRLKNNWPSCVALINAWLNSVTLPAWSPAAVLRRPTTLPRLTSKEVSVNSVANNSQTMRQESSAAKRRFDWSCKI